MGNVLCCDVPYSHGVTKQWELCSPSYGLRGLSRPVYSAADHFGGVRGTLQALSTHSGSLGEVDHRGVIFITGLLY